MRCDVTNDFSLKKSNTPLYGRRGIGAHVGEPPAAAQYFFLPAFISLVPFSFLLFFFLHEICNLLEGEFFNPFLIIF